MSKARVLVISRGGTMAMTGPAGKSVAPSLDAADLIRAGGPHAQRHSHPPEAARSAHQKS
jgi:L-asparaginase/Glu-tRNA(Gln) amidotransferase subunit D